MKPQRLIATILCIVLCGHALVRAQDMDTELSKLTEDLAGKIKDRGNKKVTVLDFTDLQGNTSELGKYIAEQLTVNLVMGKHDFSVLDRANLKKILAEHKLTASGLVDPENAKKLGLFAGVDALIIGTIIPIGTNINLTVKVITTETTEIVGAAKAKFKSDETVRQFLSQPATESKAAGSAGGAAKLQKSFGDLHVEVQSLQIVNGNQFLLTMSLANQSPKKSIWVALSSDMSPFSNLKARLTDSTGSEFQSDGTCVSGIESTPYVTYGYQGEGFYKATEIKAGDAIPATVKFISRARKTAATGPCNLQLEFLVSHDFSGGHGQGTPQNLLGKIEVE